MATPKVVVAFSAVVSEDMIAIDDFVEGISGANRIICGADNW